MSKITYDDIQRDIEDLEVGQSQFYLAGDGSIVEIARREADMDFDNPFKYDDGMGHCCYYETAKDAYKALNAELSKETVGALEDRFKEYMYQDHILTPMEDKYCGSFVVLGFKTLTDDGFFIPMDEFEENYKGGFDKDTLFDYVSSHGKYVVGIEDNWRQFGPYHELTSLYEANSFNYATLCIKNNIPIDDILLVTEQSGYYDCAVIAIENEQYKSWTGKELKDLSDEGKQALLDSHIKAFGQWTGDEVYDVIKYDKHGEEIDLVGSCLGVENVDLEMGKEPDIKKNLGVHDDIANCLYANRKELSKANKSHDER